MSFGRKQNSLLLTLCVFLYVFLALAFSGIPVLSRSAVLSMLLLFVVLSFLVILGRAAVPNWIYSPIVFMFACGVFWMTGGDDNSDFLTRVLVGWAGAILVGVSVSNGVSVRTVIFAMVAASLVNTVAVMMGFDAYIAYGVDLNEFSEEMLSKRASGLVGNANLFAVQAFAPVLAMVIWPKQSNRLLAILAISCAIYALVVSGSRKGLLLAVAIFVAYVISGDESRRKLQIAAIFISVVSLCYFAVVLSGPDFELQIRQVNAIDRVYLAMSGEDASFDERYNFIRIGERLFLESPLWGHGLGSFSKMSVDGFYSHNNFIELAVSGGIMLLSCYYYVHYRVLANARLMSRNYSHKFRLVAFVIFLLLLLDTSMVSFDTRIIPIFLMLLLGFRANHA